MICCHCGDELRVYGQSHVGVTKDEAWVHVSTQRLHCADKAYYGHPRSVECERNGHPLIGVPEAGS